MLIDNVRPPLRFRLIQTPDLIGWDGTPTEVFRSLLRDISSLVGPPGGAEDRPGQKEAAKEEAKRKAPEQAPPKSRGSIATGRRKKGAKRKAPEQAPPKIYRNSIGMEFPLIPSGTFMMGSNDKESSADEKPHEVRITRPFYMGKYEVTQGQWESVMGKGNNPSYFKGENLPVEQVSWDDAQDFITRLNKKEGVNRYRLPTEAEWEYACRAGTRTPFSFGETITADQVNYNGNYPYGDGPKGKFRQETTPVGSFPPNAWGLYDMHGNVWEWVQDWYDEKYYSSSPRNDPQGPSEPGSFRVIRGGSWHYYAGNCRSASRINIAPDYRSIVLGFRLLRTAE